MNLLNYQISFVAREALRLLMRKSTRNCLSREETAQLMGRLGAEYQSGRLEFLVLGESVRRIEIRPSGTIRLNRRTILNLDFGNRRALVDFARETIHVEKALALWSHRFLGYYHWMIEVVPKICLAKKQLGAEFEEFTLCYPMVHRKYEEECLSILGISPSKIIDTGKGVNVDTGVAAFVPGPGWFNPPPNLKILRDQFAAQSFATGPKRLFLTRAGMHHRKCINDEDVWKLLEPLGFERIEEKPRSVLDQVALFSGAECVVAVHGGALTNLVWCPTGALIIEIASRGYNPPYYKILSETCGHSYFAVLSENAPSALKNVSRDFKADIGQLQSALLMLNGYIPQSDGWK